MSMDRMISDTRIGYLNYYITNFFPKYCSFITQKELYSIINVIKENEFIKTCSFERMKNGEYNEVIDNLVVNYVEQTVSKKVSNYSKFFNYVKVLISQQNPELGDDFFDELAKKLALDVVTEGNDITDSKLFGVYGKRLLDDYDRVIDEYRNFARGWIADLVEKNSSNLSVDIQEDFVDSILAECSVKSIVYGLNQSEVLQIYNRKFQEEIQKDYSKVKTIYENNARELIERVVIVNNFGLHENALAHFIDSILSEYKLQEMINGLERNDILKKFREKQVEVNNKIEKTVRELHSKIVPAPINVKVEELIEYVKTMTLKKGKYKIDDVISGRCNDDIEKYCSKKDGGRKPINEEDVSRYISNLIVSSVSSRINELTNGDIEKIYMTIVLNMSKLRALPSDVMNHQYDNLISDTCDAYLRRMNSTKNERKPDKIERKNRKRNMAKTLFSLALVGTVTVSAVAVGNGLVNAVTDAADDIKYNAAVSLFEGRGVSDTSLISTIHSDQFSEAADNVIKFYSMCKENGLDNSKYFSLGFNLVRNQVRSDRTLAVMDVLLERVKSEAKDLEGANDLREAVDDSCFLEFIYEELYNMGCREVQDDKYLNLISEYQRADRKANPYKDETPWDYLDEDNRKLAENLMDLYESYSKNYVIEVSQLVGDKEETNGFVAFLSSTYGINTGKNRG